MDSEGNLALIWETLEIGVAKQVNVRLHISQVDFYLASCVALRNWRGRLSRNGWKGGILFMQDLTVTDETGKQVRVVLNPLSGGVLQGRLHQGGTFIATKLLKMSNSLGEDEHQRFYLTVMDWSLDAEPDTFRLSFRGEMALPLYVSQDAGICSNSTWDCLLSPWTLNAQFLSGADGKSGLQIYSSPRTIPQSFNLNRFNPAYHNLQTLGKTWSSKSFDGGQGMSLVLRVLAKSKNRMIVRQEDGRKPVILLTTLLVADLSGYCKIVIWDEAVIAVTDRIFEGDILVLGGKFKVGRCYNSPGQEKTSYFLQPKTRSVNISPVPVEIKLNAADMCSVCLLDPASSSLPIPMPLWNFKTAEELKSYLLANGRLVDVIGVITYHGRWEREKCCDKDNEPTGQFWIRVWVKLADHTCLGDNSNTEYREGVAVKLFVESDRVETTERALPGYPCIITHLMYIQSEGVFSHLECTGETQIFSGDRAFSSRFINSRTVEDFRKSWYNQTTEWSQLLREFGGFGGHLHPPMQVMMSFRSVGFVKREKSDLFHLMEKLPFRGSARHLVKGELCDLAVYKVDENGGMEEVSRQVFHEPSADLDCMGSSKLSKNSFVKNIQGLTGDNFLVSMRHNCFLSVPDPTHVDEALCIPNIISVAKLKLKDCILICECTNLSIDKLTELSGREVVLCMDFFRYQPFLQENHISRGVEIVMRSYIPQTSWEGNESGENDSLSSSKISGDNTLDFLIPFNNIS